jgi:beta-glucosidase
MKSFLRIHRTRGPALLAALAFTAAAGAGVMPFQNSALDSDARARDLVSRLTLEEKAALMCDVSDAVPRLGIRKFNWWSEALHGLANNGGVTVFPEPIGMAASFDDGLVYRIFDAVSDETRAKYHEERRAGGENRRFMSLSVWTPNVNIFRDPRWGRGQETYGEDPYLTSRMGVSVVRGLQGPADAKYRKLLACAKHYAVHSGPEWSRHTLNLTDVDPRDLHETYLPAFKALVRKADVRQVMCAYQRLDDEPCCGNSRLLRSILRDDWGYRHLVVSDCGAVTDFFTSHKVSSDAPHAASRGVLAGTDLECVWDGYSFKTLPEAVRRGLITETEIDAHLARVLSGRFELGEMDPDSLVSWSGIPMSVVNDEAHRALSLDMAREAMTLLQNRGGLLPLPKTIRKIAVIGPNADEEPVLWGNYNGTPVRTVTVLDGVASKVPADRILFDKGCDLVDSKVTECYFPRCTSDGKAGFRAVYWNNAEWKGDSVVAERIVNPLKKTTAGNHEFAPGVRLLGFSARYETEYDADRDEDLVFKGGAAGFFDLRVNGESVSRYSNWRLLPSRIPIHVEKGKRYRIEVLYAQQFDWQADLELNFGREVDVDYTGLVERLRGVDTVVFVGGLSTQLEGEEMPVELPGFRSGDRTDIELPPVQRNCLKALKAAGKKIVFVNCTGSAIALTPETESCDAILQAWYPGESGGQAVADALFGDVNPSGKLPVTFYRNSAQLPDFENYSMKGRTYRFMSDALFPFGFGLSYTTFRVGPARLDRTTVKTGETVELTVPVSNTGKREGTEIVQVYVRKTGDDDGPIRTLRGFGRVTVAAGRTANAVIRLPYDAFEFYDRGIGRMAVTAGAYEIFTGTSSADRDLNRTAVTVE